VRVLAGDEQLEVPWPDERRGTGVIRCQKCNKQILKSVGTAVSACVCGQ